MAGKFVTFYYDDAGRLQTMKRDAALDGSGNPAVQSEYGYDPQTGLLDSLVHNDGGRTLSPPTASPTTRPAAPPRSAAMERRRR